MSSYQFAITVTDVTIQVELQRFLGECGWTVLSTLALVTGGIEPGQTQPDAVFVDAGAVDSPVVARLREQRIPLIAVLAESAGDNVVPQLVREGACGCIIWPLHKLQARAAIELALAQQQLTARLKAEWESEREKLETRRLIDRAKALLMEAHVLTESEAFRRIQLQSMNSRKSMKEVAETIIRLHAP